MTRVTVNGQKYDGAVRVGFSMNGRLHRAPIRGHVSVCDPPLLLSDVGALMPGSTVRAFTHPCSRCFPKGR